MNIAIMVSGQTPLAGGGFTFEDDILEALFRLRAKSAHTYYLLGYAPERPANLDPTGLPWLTLHQAKDQRRKRKWSKVLGRAAGKLLPKSAPVSDFEAYPAVKAQPLDLICYLTPLVRPIADIPYITPVWDLAHRVTPFFPEVGLLGEWESRERRYREVLPRAAYVLALNRLGADEVRAFYGIAPERIRAMTLPTPGFALREGSAPRVEKALDHLGVRGEFLFFPAQFWAHKNHACLLLALKILREHAYQPQLVLTGTDKGNRAHIEQLVRDHGLQDQVTFAGFVSREDLASLYRQALALVFPSFFGPENLPPLEAFAFGCPVIASALPGHEVQLGDAALLVDPLQPEAWADAVWRLKQDNALRDAQIARGRTRALAYTADHYAADLFRLFDEFAPYRRCWPAGS